MPRYFFHFSDGEHTFTDATGGDFMGAEAVRVHAKRQVREIKGVLSERRILDWSSWKMIVANIEGKTVFEVGFDRGSENDDEAGGEVPPIADADGVQPRVNGRKAAPPEPALRARRGE